MNDIRRNAEGYTDPTAYKAMRAELHEEKIFQTKIDNMMRFYTYIASLNGVKIKNRIIFEEVKTGRISK